MVAVTDLTDVTDVTDVTAVPTCQGQIFDHVINASHVCADDPSVEACHDSRQAFFETVWLYLGLSIAIGVLSVLRSLSFQVLLHP